MRFRREHKRVACLGCVTLTMIAIGAAWLLGGTDGWRRVRFGCWSRPEEPYTPGAVPPEIRLSCTARYESRQFAITNGDTFAWTNVRIQLNQGHKGGVYELFVNRIDSKATHTAPAMQFARRTGTRFSPSVDKPANLYILAKTPDGEGHWSTTFP